MSPEQWQRIDQLFHAALACEPGERTEFLANQCAGDEPLRREVESLLSSLEEADDFIETPAGDVAAELLGTHKSAFEPGQQIENYRIVRQLGSGGMGEVFLAEDIRLTRKVALKLLPPHFTVNPDRVRRFEREARAASALNHPNIVTIYEIGQSSTTHFIATEFVDGKTLRQLINEKPFTLNETLNVSMQVADALSGAHAAGIVHRDIKPENIMVRRDGYVKILDFGLAKLTEQQTNDSDLETPTLLQSNPGLVMGTVQYMSPEQARAKNVGVATDIWSLGIVMYELLAGHVPFNGETSSHVMVSLMEDKLPPLRVHATVPDELDRFVTKALRKNQKERYQTAVQLARDLKHFKQKLQRDSGLNEWLKTVPSREGGAQPPPLALASVSGAHPVPFETRVAAETTPLQTHSTSSTEYLVREIKTHRLLVFFALVVVVGGAIGLTYFFRNRTSSGLSQTSATAMPASANPTPNRGTTNEEAYRHYRQGRNLINQRNPADVKRAIENFQEAIRLDPNFAQPYAGLANAYLSMGNWGDGRDQISKVYEAINKALELDNNLAEAYAVRGFVNSSYEYDFTAAERDVRRALELEPENDWAHWVHSMILADTGRFDEALKAIETAQGLAPGTAVYERDRGRLLYYGRRYDEAIVQLKRAIELKRDFHSAWSWIVRAHEMKGDQAGAFDWFIGWREFKKFEKTEEYRQAYEADGWMGVKRKFLDFVKSGKDYPGMHKYEIAGNLAQLGETSEAFSYLNKAIDEREWEVAMLNIDPYLDGLRGDPRFKELVKRANFR
jgi:serine/threonine protein kinase